jgi:phage terminase large subunit GpA-like protein
VGRPDIVEWLEEHRFLSPEASNEPGPFRISRTPYLATILRACNDPDTRQVVVMGGSQCGKSEIILSLIAYRVVIDPAPTLLLSDNLISCKALSEDRLAPMFRDSPILAELVSMEKGPASESSTYKFLYPGGAVHLVGSNSNSGVSMRPCKYVCIDEASRCSPEVASKIGVPIGMAIHRTATYPDAQIFMCSSPALAGSCRIEAEFLAGTQEYWWLPCPRCHSMQRLIWKQLDFETGKHKCEECGALSGQAAWQRQKGEWRSNLPVFENAAGEAVVDAAPTSGRTRSFHINCLMSTFLRWTNLIEEWKEANRLKEEGDYSKLKNFICGRLGEPWAPPSMQIKEQELMRRCETYSAELPSQVKAILGPIDTQDRALEYLVCGVADRNEFFMLERGSISGDLKTDYAEMYAEVDARIIKRLWETADGRLMRLTSCVQDSGGHHSEAVARACRERPRHLISYRGGPSLPGRPLCKMTLPDGGVWKCYGAGDFGKDLLFQRLINPPPGPGTIHFPTFDEWHHGFTEEFFAEVTSEKKEVHWESGRRVVKWKKKKSGGRNESLDLLTMLLILHEAKQAQPIEKLPAMYLPAGTKKDPQTGRVVVSPAPETPPKHPLEQPVRAPVNGHGRRRQRPSFWGGRGLTDLG